MFFFMSFLFIEKPKTHVLSLKEKQRVIELQCSELDCIARTMQDMITYSDGGNKTAE